MVSSEDRDASFDAAFPDLYSRARGLAQRIVGDLPTAEDVAAEAMVRTLLHWRHVGGLGHRDAWVLRVTTNLALDVTRRRARRGDPAVLDVDALADRGDAAEASVLRLALVEALMRLPRRQREVLVLTYLVGLPPSQVAASMGISVSSAGQHGRRALGRLRELVAVDWLPPEGGTLAAEL
jgi:RNA polymerase sigma factor (sigma-70 family)